LKRWKRSVLNRLERCTILVSADTRVGIRCPFNERPLRCARPTRHCASHARGSCSPGRTAYRNEDAPTTPTVRRREYEYTDPVSLETNCGSCPAFPVAKRCVKRVYTLAKNDGANVSRRNGKVKSRFANAQLSKNRALHLRLPRAMRRRENIAAAAATACGTGAGGGTRSPGVVRVRRVESIAFRDRAGAAGRDAPPEKRSSAIGKRTSNVHKRLSAIK
jgi:hypothetical protein